MANLYANGFPQLLIGAVPGTSTTIATLNPNQTTFHSCQVFNTTSSDVSVSAFFTNKAGTQTEVSTYVVPANGGFQELLAKEVHGEVGSSIQLIGSTASALNYCLSVR